MRKLDLKIKDSAHEAATPQLLSYTVLANVIYLADIKARQLQESGTPEALAGVKVLRDLNRLLTDALYSRSLKEIIAEEEGKLKVKPRELQEEPRALLSPEQLKSLRDFIGH